MFPKKYPQSVLPEKGFAISWRVYRATFGYERVTVAFVGKHDVKSGKASRMHGK